MGNRWRFRHDRSLLLVAVSIGTMTFFLRSQDFPAMGRAFAHADGALLAGAVGAYFLSLWVRAVRWRLLLAHLRHCSDWHAFHALAIGTMANSLLPAKAGLVARAHILGKRTETSRVAIGGSLILEALFDGLVLAALLAIALGLLPLDATMRLLALIFASGIAAGLLLAIAVAFQWRPLTRPWGAVLMRCPQRVEAIARELARQLVHGLGALRSGARLGRVLGMSALSWGLMALAYYALGAAFDLPLTYLHYLAVMAVMSIAIAFPGAAGGVGPAELVVAQVLASFAVGQPLAAAYVVALRALLVLPIVLLGLALIWSPGLLARVPTLRRPAAQPSAAAFGLRLFPRLRLVGRPITVAPVTPRGDDEEAA